jgi:murein DD-endopeptidase MepM/ murein hydrolase activator NlpD
MTWPARFGWRVGAVAVLAALVVVASGTDSAARVAPEWSAPVSASAVSTPAASAAAVSAPSAEVPRGRWTWPLLPRPAVVAGFDAPEVRWGSGHRGVDLAAAVGQSVLATSDGVVTFRGVVVDRGVLVVETAGGLRTTFEPVASSLSAGATVTQGQPVGTVAGTPGHCAPATCLHWGVLRDDVYLDPLALVGAVRVVLLPLRPP